MSSPPRVFLGLIEVSGYYSRLEQALRSIGVPASFVDLSFHRFGYTTSSESWWPVRLMRAATRRHGRMAWLPARVMFWCAKFAVFLWALATCNVFVFSYATTFFWLRELPLLRLLGKRIVFVFHGSDCRPPYLDGGDVRALSRAALAALTAERKRRVRYIEHYADAVVVPLTCAQFFEKPVVSFTAIGIPIGTVPAAMTTQPADAPPRLVHAPSDPAVKGTQLIRSAVETMRRRGHAVDYREIVGRPHHEVQNALAASDILVDQAFSDTPMPGLASEAAALGRPTVIGGYGWAELERLSAAGDVPPTVRCAPEELPDTIERLVLDSDLRRQHGEAARRFVESHWSPRAVAARVVRLFDGRPEAEWLVDPRRLRYVLGGGMPRDMVARTIADLIEHHGTAALQLEDKPELRAEAIALAGGDARAEPTPVVAAAVNS